MIVYYNVATNERPERGGKRASPHGIGATLALNLAKGKGELTLNSPDYRVQPYIDYNYLEEEEDRKTRARWNPNACGFGRTPSVKKTYPKS